MGSIKTTYKPKEDNVKKLQVYFTKDSKNKKQHGKH